MVREYRRQRDRLRLLSKYTAILTHSTHMQKEYINHGLNTARVFGVKYGTDEANSTSGTAATAAHDGPWELLFAGRMDELKGGRELILALPHVVKRLGRDVRVTFAGDGPMRGTWESLAQRICRAESRLHVRFPGWLHRKALDTLFSQADLLVLPSLWPEPLALVGIEAARHRLPVAAFAVGGISDWLTPGKNGYLAPGDPPTVEGLVDAIAACLQDPSAHARLRDGAGALSADFAFDKHLTLLLRAFDDATRSSSSGRQN